MKSLFFEEKDVQIIDLNTDAESPKKKDKKVRKKINKIKSEGKKHSVKINTKTEFVDEEIDPNLLLLNPFYNFEDFLMGPGQSPEDKRKPQPNTISPATNPGKITFLDPGFSPLFISDFTPSRSYSEGLGHRQSDLRWDWKLKYMETLLERILCELLWLFYEFSFL